MTIAWSTDEAERELFEKFSDHFKIRAIEIEWAIVMKTSGQSMRRRRVDWWP